jgi:hypothetical protein
METLFLIVTQDLMALDNAKEFIRQADERGKGRDRIKVILNRVARRQKPDLDGLESYLGVRPAGVFSDDSEALYEVWSEGRMLSARRTGRIAESPGSGRIRHGYKAGATKAGNCRNLRCDRRSGAISVFHAEKRGIASM